MKSIKTQSRVLFPELSYRVMEAIFEVHNQLGPGFNEKIYENALRQELADRNIHWEQQKVVPIMYKNKPIGTFRLDLVVGDKIILELKAVDALNDLFKTQLLSYLKASGLQLGILVNFGAKRVEYQRIAN